MTDRWRRGWMIAGIASAVLNVFLIGFLAGRQVIGPGGCGGRGFGREHRGVLHQYIAPEERARLRERLGEIRRARADVRAALRQEPFERARLDAALAALRTHSAEIQAEMHAVLLERAAKLSPEQRRRLAESRILRPALGP